MDPGITVAGGDERQTIVDRIAQLHRIDLGIGTHAQQTSVEPMISEEGTHLALDESGLELDGIGHGRDGGLEPVVGSDGGGSDRKPKQGCAEQWIIHAARS